uniref:Uncharacterized protein n=1 Tax=Amphimedon queenslandica TaxID=400682 RepID=A0A1X7UC02_AMPQE
MLSSSVKCASVKAINSLSPLLSRVAWKDLGPVMFLQMCLSPKSSNDIGEFKVHVCIEKKILQPVFDSCSSSQTSSTYNSSRSPRKKRSIAMVDYNEFDTESVETDEDNDGVNIANVPSVVPCTQDSVQV